MDNYQGPPSTPTAGSLFSNKNALIIVLVILLLLSLLGINVITMVGELLQSIVQIFTPLITQILSIFGYTAGTVINKTTDIVGDTVEVGVDIAQGTLYSVGDLLKNASQGNVDKNAQRQLDNSLNISTINKHSPQPDSSTNPIQKPITAAKTSWCLVGEYKGRRGCIEIGEHDKCLSGQVFPDQKICLNPTLTTNAKQ